MGKIRENYWEGSINDSLRAIRKCSGPEVCVLDFQFDHWFLKPDLCCCVVSKSFCTSLFIAYSLCVLFIYFSRLFFILCLY